MKPTITMFCQDCGEQITGQFAASCRKCVSSRAADNRHSLQQLKAEILPMINSIREDLNRDALNSFYTNRACDNLDIVAAKLSAV